MIWLKQSTQVTVVIGPVWATADGSLKSDLAYNASGINCDIYKNGTKADITLTNSAGDGYFRAGSGEAQYLLTLSTGHTDTLGAARLTLSATGYYMKPVDFMVVPANVWDSMFGADYLQVDAVQISGDGTAADNCELMFDGTGYAGGTTKLAVEVNTKTGFSLANGSITAATFAAGAVNAAALAADAGTEIGAAVKTAVEAAGSHLALIKAKTDNLPSDPADQSLLEAAIAGLNDLDAAAVQTAAAAALTAYDPPTKTEMDAAFAVLPDAEDVAEAVRDVDNTSPAASSLGAAVNSASSAGDPWSTALPGAYGAGTAGQIVGDMDTVVAAIKAKTDNLPSDPADQSLLEAAISAIEVEGGSVDAAAIAALVLARLGAARVTIKSPVASNGTITIYQGDDYVATEGRALTFAIADRTHLLGLDQEGASATLKLQQATWAATDITETTEGYYVIFEPTAEETAALTELRQSYELECVTAAGSVVTTHTGFVLLVRDIPVVS